MARKKSITKKRKALFLAELRETGAVTKAATAGEIGRSSWYDLRERDLEFAGDWDDADAEFMDEVEAEAFDRGMNGVEERKPYVNVNGDTKKTKFYTITRKSDRMLELTLKARHHRYKPATVKDPGDGDGAPPPTQPNWDNLTPLELQQLTVLQRKLHAIGDPGES